MPESQNSLVQRFRSFTRWQRGPVCLASLMALGVTIQFTRFIGEAPALASTRHVDSPDPGVSVSSARWVPRIKVPIQQGQANWALEPRIERGDDAWLLRGFLGVEQLELVELDDSELVHSQLQAWARRICHSFEQTLFLIDFEDSSLLVDIETELHSGCPTLAVVAVELIPFQRCGYSNSKT